MEEDLPGEQGYALRKYGPPPAQKGTEEEAKGVDRDNPQGEARASAPSASGGVAFLYATHQVGGHCAEDDIGVQSGEATSTRSEDVAKKVDPDNPSRQAAAYGNLEGASPSEASEVRGELVGDDGKVQDVTDRGDGNIPDQQSSESSSGEDKLLQSPTTLSSMSMQEEEGAIEPTSEQAEGDTGGEEASESSMGSRTEASRASADNPVVDMDRFLAKFTELQAESEKRLRAEREEADKKAEKLREEADKKAEKLREEADKRYQAERKEAEKLRDEADKRYQAERREDEGFRKEVDEMFAMHVQRFDSSLARFDSIRRLLHLPPRGVKVASTDGGKIVNIEPTQDATAIEQMDLSHEAFESTKRIEGVKTNVEVELSQETTIVLGIIKDLEDDVKIERAQEKREVPADDVLRGSLPKDPDIFCKVLRGKTRSSMNGRVRTQKWRSAGSQSLHKNGRTSISRMSLDQRPQKGRQRRFHATTDGQMSESVLILEYRFVDKPP